MDEDGPYPSILLESSGEEGGKLGEGSQGEGQEDACDVPGAQALMTPAAVALFVICRLGNGLRVQC